MKILIAILALALAGCSTTTETTMRGKEIVKLEKRGWNVLNFIGDLAENFLVNTATNLVNEQFRADPARVGLRK